MQNLELIILGAMELSNVQDRSGYLGGTDAALVGRLGGGLKVYLTHFLRLAVAYGDLPGRYLRQAPKTEAMEAGHRFEDYFFDVIAPGWTPRIQRQYILKRPMEGLPALIAHADGYDARAGLVLELKFSRYRTVEVMERYRWQLQWYYFLGAEKVRLIHGSGTLPEDVHIAFRQVEKEAAAQEQLMAGLLRIRDMRRKIREVAERIGLKNEEDHESKGN
ncbi:MAG: hypothetical protein LUE20_00115 [Oscillospiraceae bacterium]|nr:hypothetical protein [Oscillospiraceae bacterium]